MALEITVGPPQLAINEGNVVLVTDPDGQIVFPSDKGVYFFDTRLVNSWSISTIGLDLAKNVFQVHGIDANEKVVVRKQLRRSQVIAFFEALPPCLVGMEACATAHHWARELRKLGHEVRLMPAKDVKAYVKRNKNDAADAEAICEAVRRPTMRFVTVKSVENRAD